MRETWLWVIAAGVVVGDYMGIFDGTWFGDVFKPLASLLLFAWLILFAIGVSRGEPNP